MNWLNLEIALLRSPQFIGASPAERGTWLALMAWCATQENGGIIENSAAWPSRKWEQLCAVSRAELDAQCELFHWEGENLMVWGYPVAHEATTHARRMGGKNGGRPPKNPAKNLTENLEKPQGFQPVNLEKPQGLHTENPNIKKDKIRKDKSSQDTREDGRTDGLFLTLAETLDFAKGAGIPGEVATKWFFRHQPRGFVDDSGHPLRDRAAALIAWAESWVEREKKSAPILEFPKKSVTPEPLGWREACRNAGYDVDPDWPWLQLPDELKALAVKLLGKEILYGGGQS